MLFDGRELLRWYEEQEILSEIGWPAPFMSVFSPQIHSRINFPYFMRY